MNTSAILRSSVFALACSSACSLVVAEQTECIEDSQCSAAFGPGSVCDIDGFCTAPVDGDGVGILVDGVSPTTVRAIGVSAQTGTTRDLGVGMRVGIEAALRASSFDQRGGYALQYFARDDGYVPERAATIIEEITVNGGNRVDPQPSGGADEVVGREAFAVIGSMGSPTSKAMLGTVNERQVLFFGTYSGASHLYNEPADRVVWQYRPRYEDESYRLTHWLTMVRDPNRIPATNVFALSQSPVMGTTCAPCVSDSQGTAGQAAAAAQADQTVMDAYGFSGYLGIRRALQEAGVSQVDIPLATYRANSTDLAVALHYFAQWTAGIATGAHAPVAGAGGALDIGIVMIPVALPGAEFVEGVVEVIEQFEAGIKPTTLSDAEWALVSETRKTELLNINLVITSISPAGDVMAETLAAGNATRLCGSHDIVVSQVVPFPIGDSNAAITFRSDLQAYDPNAVPGFVTFEGWAVGKIWAELIRRTATGGEITTDRVIQTLETNFRNVDLGIGTVVDFSNTDHLGSETIFGSRLDATCHYQSFEIGT